MSDTTKETAEATTALTGDENAEATETTDASSNQQDAPENTEATDTEQSKAEQAEGYDGKDKDTTEGEKSEEESEAEAFDPEKLELPEGFALDEQMMEQFTPLAEELGLGQEQAQKLISMHSEAIQSAQQQMVEQHQEQVSQWAENAKADKEFGGDRYTESLATAKQALQQYGTPELIQVLNESGLGNHPELIRAFYRAGKNLSEDTFDGAASPGQERSLADRMYPNSKEA